MAELRQYHVYPYLAAWQLGWSDAPQMSMWESEFIYSDKTQVSEAIRAYPARIYNDFYPWLTYFSLAPEIE